MTAVAMPPPEPERSLSSEWADFWAQATEGRPGLPPHVERSYRSAFFGGAVSALMIAAGDVIGDLPDDVVGRIRAMQREALNLRSRNLGRLPE